MRALVLAALLTAAASVVQAHDVRGTTMYLDVGTHAVGVELHLPLAQLLLALPQPVAAAYVPAAPELASYLRAHLSARTRSGTALRCEIDHVALQPAAEGSELTVQARLLPPASESTRWLELHYDAIVHRVVTHNVYVFLRRDVQSGVLEGEPSLLGMLHWQNKSLVVDRTAGSAWRGIVAAFMLGVRHIQEGTDHLLFLFMLLLPAPLWAAAGRWGQSRGGKRSALAVFRLVTAFTVGHSLTLVAATLHWATLPSQPVEVLIAVSIAVSGAHAQRPLFAGRETLVAAGFGLVHGLAFATVLEGFGFDATSLALALLGFNLGIEAMQLGVVVLVMPWLLLASRSERYVWLRVPAAMGGMIAALGWIAERAWGLHTVVPALTEALAAHSGWLLAGLALTATAMSLRIRPSRNAASHSSA